MCIPFCYRCLGILTLWREKNGATHEAHAFHINPPGNLRFARQLAKVFFRDIRHHTKQFDLLSVYGCGGDVATPRNRFFYDLMCNLYLRPFERRFPCVPIRIFNPNNWKAGTSFATLSMDEACMVTCEYDAAPKDWLLAKPVIVGLDDD